MSNTMKTEELKHTAKDPFAYSRELLRRMKGTKDDRVDNEGAAVRMAAACREED